MPLRLARVQSATKLSYIFLALFETAGLDYVVVKAQARIVTYGGDIS